MPKRLGILTGLAERLPIALENLLAIGCLCDRQLILGELNDYLNIPDC